MSSISLAGVVGLLKLTKFLLFVTEVKPVDDVASGRKICVTNLSYDLK